VSEGLIVPKQVEYVIVKPRRTRVPLAWTIALLAAIIVVVGAVLFVRHYREPHKYPLVQLPYVGLKASLRTKWVNGSGQYIFQVRPTPGNEARFASVIQTIPRDQLKFQVHLVDTDGFEVCSAIPTMVTLRAVDGKASGLKADQTFPNCTEEQIRAAEHWHVTYNFPSLTANISPPLPSPEEQDAGQKAQLTGADILTGEVETLNSGSFKVLKSAEYMTLLGWTSPDELRLSCKGSLCVLTNLRTGESVHVRKR
jgi:hypothetical protein